jgi:hypothetical protein
VHLATLVESDDLDGCGRAVQVQPMKSKRKVPGTKRLKRYSGFKFCFQFHLAPLQCGCVPTEGNCMTVTPGKGKVKPTRLADLAGSEYCAYRASTPRHRMPLHPTNKGLTQIPRHVNVRWLTWRAPNICQALGRGAGAVVRVFLGRGGGVVP